jgi:hypothetical protein
MAATNVIAWPIVDGFGELVNVVSVVAFETVCPKAAEVLVVKLLSPP